MRQEIVIAIWLQSVENFLHNWQEFWFTALSLRDAIQKKGGITPKCWMFSNVEEHIYLNQQWESKKNNSDHAKKQQLP